MRNILIFGTNRGIGLALTKRYIENGDHVWALCRNSSSELAETKAHVIENCEVTDLKSLNNIASKLTDTKFDLLIHNAGIWVDESLYESKQSDFDAISNAFEVNSIAPLKVISVFHKLLSTNAKVAFMSSRMGSISDNSSGGRYGYRMSKAALNAAVKSISLDLPEHPVAALHPGFVKTDMTGDNGLIDTTQSAQGLFDVLEGLKISNTGSFWHSNGERLDW